MTFNLYFWSLQYNTSFRTFIYESANADNLGARILSSKINIRLKGKIFSHKITAISDP